MPSPNVSPCADVTLSVPAVAAESFRAEVLDTLKCAGENVVEGAEWFLKQSDLNRLDQEDRPNLEHAQRLFDAIRDQRGDIMVTAPADRLAEIVRDAMSQAASEVVDALDEHRTTPNGDAEHARAARRMVRRHRRSRLAGDEVEDGGSR